MPEPQHEATRSDLRRFSREAWPENWVRDQRPYRTTTYAVRIDEPFEVLTADGTVRAGAFGDWLAVDEGGHPIVIPAATFAQIFRRVRDEPGLD